MASSNDPPQNVTPYSLQETQQEGTGFRSKADDIFGSLGGLEVKYQDGVTKRKDDKKRSHNSDDDDDEEQFKKPCPPSSRERSSDSRDRRHESSSDRSSRDDRRFRDFEDRHQNRGSYSRDRGRGRFSRPYGRSRQPDYKLNPDKYKKYSLEDTSLDGDKSNRSVALDFISELRKRKADENATEDSEGGSEGCSKIEFHKPATASSQDMEDDGGKRKNYGQVYRMSEYVVGMSKKPKPRHHAKVSSAGSTDDKSDTNKQHLSFGHLAEEDDVEAIEPMEEINQSDDTKDSNQPMGTQSSKETTANAEQGDSPTEPEKEPVQFKFAKGKGKRKIRQRQADEDGDD